MFGRLTLDAFKHGPIESATSVGIVISSVLVVALMFYFNSWKKLWYDWLISLDPKKIGKMYFIVALLMLFKGVVDAGMMRAQLAIATGDSQGFLSATHFQQVFTAHGTTMIFFVGMGTIFGLLNLVVPLQIGARDVAFPFLNSLSFWLFTVGAVLVNISLMIGNFSAAGWLAYPPLSELYDSPDVGVDYWIWSVQISGVGSLMSGINFLVTILKMRCPGMTLMKMPMFTWSALNSMVLVIFAFPILTVTLGLLSLDRLMNMHFFTAGGGGNPMLFINMIWAWGHPEVYILMLPAFGVFSEVVATFSEKRLFGYSSMVGALISITFLSFIVWLHHFFTMGASANVNAFFGIMTMLIAVPTGVKIFNWIFTMLGGRVHFTTPMLWFFGFIFIFTTGGMTGVLLSIPAADYQVHNSLFLIAHFHSMVVGGVLFGVFAAYNYWFPKFMGFKLDEKLGKYAFWSWLIGVILAFMPLYILGLMGATRRIHYYEASTGWQPLYIVAAAGIPFVALGILIQNWQLLKAIMRKNEKQLNIDDPWNGRTLEWAAASPPAFYNFSEIPHVEERDAFWEMKKNKIASSNKNETYHDIHMPKDTALGLYISGFAFLIGFGLIWHIWWMAIIGLIGAVIGTIVRLSSENVEEVISGSVIAEIEKEIALTKGLL